jgi:hypothetical protein
MSDFEQQWAVALKKTKLKTKVPLQANEDEIVELLKLKKEQLNTAITERDKISAEKILKTIIKENEKLLLLRLQKIQEKSAYLDEDLVKTFVTKHLQNCGKLVLLVKSLT